MRYKKIVFTIILIQLLFLLSRCSDITFAIFPNEWNFGKISSEDTVGRNITIRNTGRKEAAFSIISTCNCLSAEPEYFELSAGEKIEISLNYNPSGNAGYIESMFLLSINREVVEGYYFPVYGTVVPEVAGTEKQLEFYMSYYFESECAACRRPFVEEILHLEEELGIGIFLEERNVLDARIRKEYLSILTRLGLEDVSLPALVIGDTVLQGKDEIDKQLKKQLESLIEKRRK